MKVLVATARTQGTMAYDESDCVDGELVFMIEACPAARRSPYGPCRCGITFRGMSSDGATTTAAVRDMPGLSLDQYIGCLDATHCAKRAQGCTCDFDAFDDAWTLLAIAGSYPVGTVVERVVDRVQVRRAAGA